MFWSRPRMRFNSPSGPARLLSKSHTSAIQPPKMTRDPIGQHRWVTHLRGGQPLCFGGKFWIWFDSGHGNLNMAHKFVGKRHKKRPPWVMEFHPSYIGLPNEWDSATLSHPKNSGGFLLPQKFQAQKRPTTQTGHLASQPDRIRRNFQRAEPLAFSHQWGLGWKKWRDVITPQKITRELLQIQEHNFQGQWSWFISLKKNKQFSF